MGCLLWVLCDGGNVKVRMSAIGYVDSNEEGER